MINNMMIDGSFTPHCRHKTTYHSPDPWIEQCRSSPVLVLLVEVSHDVQQTADEGVCSCRAGGALARGLSSKHGTAPLCVSQLLLHLDILLPEQGQVLLQLGHLLCPSKVKKTGHTRHRDTKPMSEQVERTGLRHFALNLMRCYKVDSSVWE